ncbi:putative hydrolase of the HAD superfamily [Amycolatopsis bartoniae]|uniref:HAD family hydrolase n=1 Tax=Amycolatopsis bartoniae TaxID=941986 RepID=A0A8H9MD07_9PSEU|nr:HAD family hydrolase [Amycolatopsis bartoniae]MBB2940204.1 putative hydrolase of the HAD superfamily [Amycolatopsis bartoniae]GHF66391.1 hypothetical protein GCM10017566_45220 [Amycolatopsis bartoniae]
MTLKGVCFDLYSTLVHENGNNPFYTEVAQALGLELDRWMPVYRRRHRETMAGVISGMVERVLLSARDAGVHCERRTVESVVDRCMPGFIDSIHVDPQAGALLGHLCEEGYSLALVTNASDHSEGIFDHLGLREYFDVTVFSYRVGYLKPDPRIYRCALDGLGLPAALCGYVGDGGDQELWGARAAGFTTILVDRDLPHSGSARADADLVAADLTGVGHLLDSLAA